MSSRLPALAALGTLVLGAGAAASGNLIASPRAAAPGTVAASQIESRQNALARAIVQGWSQHASANLAGPGIVDVDDPAGSGTLWSSNTSQLPGILLVQNLGDTSVQFRTSGGLILATVEPGVSRVVGGFGDEMIVPTGQTLEFNGSGIGSRLFFAWRVSRPTP